MAIHRRLFFLLICLLPLQLGFHFWPAWAHILGRRIDYLSPTLFITDILVFLILISWKTSRQPAKRTRPLSIKRRGFMVGISTVLFIVVNIIMAASPATALYKWIKMIEFAGLGWYIVQTKVRAHDLFLPLRISIVYTFMLAIIQLLQQHSVGGVFWWMGERELALDTPGVARFNLCLWSHDVCQLILRPYATFPHPNVLGGFFAVTLPFLIYQCYEVGQKKMRWAAYGILLVGITGLLVSFSRGAWLTGVLLAVGSLYVLWRKVADKSLIIVVHRLIIPFIFVAVFITGLILYFPSATDESVVRRNELNNAAIMIWQHSPMFGVGLGNFLVELPTASAARSGNYLQPAHNIYILAITEIGLLGVLWLFFIIMWLGGWFSGNTYRLPVIDAKTVVLSVMPVVGIGLLGLIDHYPTTLQQGQLLTIVLFSLLFSRLR